jgi:predicted GNAT family acetyltransferase
MPLRLVLRAPRRRTPRRHVLRPRRRLSRAANRSTLKQPSLSLNRRLALLRGRRNIRRNIRPNIRPTMQRSTHRNMSTISHDQSATRFTTELEGHLAELDYTVAGDVMTITHTRVPQPIAGRGIAAELMRAALEVAAERGWSINPACSYAAAYMRKQNPGADKRHMDSLLDEALDESFPASDSPSVGGSN